MKVAYLSWINNRTAFFYIQGEGRLTRVKNFPFCHFRLEKIQEISELNHGYNTALILA